MYGIPGMSPAARVCPPTSPLENQLELTSFCHIGYRLKSVRRPKDGIEADLQLIGKPANAYGVDVKDLVLKVAYVNDNGASPLSSIPGRSKEHSRGG